MITQVSAVKRELIAWRQRLWRHGEQLISEHLTAEGWQVLERNWRAGRCGEIDIIACDPSGVLVFVEVKTRLKKLEAGIRREGFESISFKKRKKLTDTAARYLSKARYPPKGYRIDVIAVTFDAPAESRNGYVSDMIELSPPSIIHIKEAVS